jgi:uncharacterized membrane protein YeaQ/YmgE (transglycosylase-associated protein family)
MESDLPLTPLGVTVTVLAAILITLLPRRMAMMPIMAAVCFLPTGQSLQIAGLHFYLFRLVLLASLTRVLIRGEVRSIRWCLLDTLMFSWMAAFVVFGSLSQVSFITQGGITFDWLTGYIVARSLLRDRNDFLLQIRFLAIVIIPLASAMIVEMATGRNLFAVLGGVAETSALRDGKVRAQGAFQHSILAGTFGATLLPLMIGLIRMGNRRLRLSGIIGSFCAALIVLAAASSGPFLAAWGSIVTFCIWGLRHSLRLVRVGLLLIVLMLQAGMDRPVWWIFDAVGDFAGGSGWHRSYIIDAAIRHWDEWWLVGTSRTVHWGGYPPPPNDPNNVDITNEYIAQAVHGGALTLFLFLAILWTCFKRLGTAFRTKRGSIEPETEWLAWCTGVALLAHCISFLSVSYYDQTIFYFFWLLSAIAAGTMEQTWLICDQPVRSVGHRVKLPGAIRGVRRTLSAGEPLH